MNTETIQRKRKEAVRIIAWRRAIESGKNSNEAAAIGQKAVDRLESGDTAHRALSGDKK